MVERFAEQMESSESSEVMQFRSKSYNEIVKACRADIVQENKKLSRSVKVKKSYVDEMLGQEI